MLWRCIQEKRQACGRWGEVGPGGWGFLQRQIRPGMVQKRPFRERGRSTGDNLGKRKRAACDLGIKCLPQGWIRLQALQSQRRKVLEVNEQCFKDGHLKFAGDKTWRYKVLDP